MILGGVARQCLQKLGVQLWWVNVPRELPLPAVFVGVDVFHAPPSFNKATKKKQRKPSCAAIIVQLIRKESAKSHRVELYSETHQRAAGEEYQLREPLKDTIRNALNAFKVNPASMVVCVSFPFRILV